MKRPLFAFSVLFLAAMAAAQLGGGLSGLGSAGGVLLFAVCLPRGKRRAAGQFVLCGALASLLALAVSGGFQLRLDRWRGLEGQTVSFTAWVEEENPYTAGRLTLQGRVERNGKWESIRLDIQGMGEEAASPGQWFAGKLLVLEAREDGDALGGVSLFGIALENTAAIPAPAGFHPLAEMAALRHRLSQAVWEDFPGEASSVVLAMVFSRQDKLPASRLEELNRAGLRHLLVVSGLHLSIITGWLRESCRRLGLGRRVSGLLGLLAIWGMAGLAGFSPSVLRAAVTTSLFLLGQLLLHQPDSLTSLGLAGLLLCLLSPPVLFRTGYQLTFAATLGLLLGMKPLTALLERLWEGRSGALGPAARWLLEGFAAAVCAQLGALPVLAAQLGRFTLWGLATTLPAIPLAAAVILLGGVGAALLSVPLFASAGGLLLRLARAPARLLLLLGEGTGRLPDLSFPVLVPWQLALCVLLPVGAYLSLTLFPQMKLRRGRLFLRGSLWGAVLVLACLWVSTRTGTVISVGSTGAVVIASPEGTVVLDAGESAWERRALSAQLLRCGARGPLVMAASGEVSLNGLVWWRQEFSPAVLCLGEEDAGLLAGQLPGNYLPLGREPQEVLPGVFLSRPQTGMILAETAGRKVLKSQASYAIIEQSALPEEADLCLDRFGRAFSGGSGLRLHPMPSGDSNLMLGW